MTCSKVVIINEGVIVAADSTENIGRSLTESHQVELTIGGNTARVKDTISGLEGVKSVSSSGNRFIVDSEKDRDLRAEIARKVVGGGFDLLEMRSHSMTLEDVFLKLVTEEEGIRQ